jgi:NADH-quinone oxidoreductase subunit M
MANWPLLTVVTFLPLVGVLFILALVRGDEVATNRNARYMALWTSLATFLVSLLIWINFDKSKAGFQFLETLKWFDLPGNVSLNYKMGVDGISMFFVLLSTLLTPICVISCWSADKERVREYMIAFLVLETLMVGTFCALDLFTFYVFFEGVLIPMFLIIGVWGGERRVYSAFKFFLYTLLGSVLMLLAMFALYFQAGTTDIVALLAFAKEKGFDQGLQIWLWLAFFASFAVKTPMWPVHTWLPDAHVEAPTAGSVVLAAILLKMGGYGFLRFSLPMFPDASVYFTPLMFALSVIAIVYTSLVAWRQTDMKKLIAYSSVAHMGFVTLGVFSGTEQGVQGAIFQMLSHGVISGALFLCVGVLYDRMHTREIASYGGVVHRMPVYAAVFMLFTLGNVGLPGLSGFPGEILSLAGAFQVNLWVAAGAALGGILAPVYALPLYRRIVYGSIENPKLVSIRDLETHEWVQFAPLVLAVIALGLAPILALDFTRATSEALVEAYRAHMGAAP